jgi:hypothetical protein
MTVDNADFDTLVRDLAANTESRRTLIGVLVAGLLGAVLPVAHEAAAGGKCGKRTKCHGGCCPGRAPVCCRTGCCRKGFDCCRNGTRCCKK